MNRRLYHARPLGDLPFYCHPVYLFLGSWIVMLGTLEVQVSDSTFPDRSLGIFLFLISVCTMLLGFAIARMAEDRESAPKVSLSYAIDAERLRRITSILGISVVLLTIFNFVTAGPPPFFGFFGIDTATTQEYGRYKQVILPMAMALFVNSLLDPSRMRRWFWAVFSLGTLVLYVGRGDLILSLAQGLMLYSIRTPASRGKIYLRALLVAVIGFAAVDLIGNNRTSQDVFFEFMQIKTEFHSWPMALLWPISYFSTPVSNLCWIIHNSHFSKPAISFLYPVLPAFWAPLNPHEIPLSDSHIIDGVHTYLANYFLDFSWFGVVGCNFVIGLLGGFLVNGQRVSRKFLTSPILLSAVGFVFFWDYFIYLPTIVEFAIQSVVQKLCIVPVASDRAASQEYSGPSMPA